MTGEATVTVVVPDDAPHRGVLQDCLNAESVDLVQRFDDRSQEGRAVGRIILNGAPQEVKRIVDEIRPRQKEIVSNPLESPDENLGDLFRDILDFGKRRSRRVDHPGPAREHAHRQSRRLFKFKSHSGDFSSGHVIPSGRP